MYEMLVKKMMNVGRQSKYGITGLKDTIVEYEHVFINNSILGLPIPTKVSIEKLPRCSDKRDLKVLYGNSAQITEYVKTTKLDKGDSKVLYRNSAQITGYVKTTKLDFSENIRRSSLYPVVYVKDDDGSFKRIDNFVTEQQSSYVNHTESVVENHKSVDDPFQIIESIELPEEEQDRNVFVKLFRWFEKKIHDVTA